MKTRFHLVVRSTAAIVLLLLSVSTISAAQRTRDPLNDKEVDILRDFAQEPTKRMQALVKFARARMAVVDQIRTNQKIASEQADKISEVLEDFAYIVDEIDDNLDSYNSKGEDLRKALRGIIEANTEFQLKLRTIKETSSPEQLKLYGFALESATDSVNASADSARAMLDDQMAKKGKEKEEKPEKAAKKGDKRDDDRPKDNTPPDYTGMGGVGRTPPQ